MLFQSIQTTEKISRSKACELLHVSRHSHSEWLKPKPVKEDKTLELIQQIKDDPDNRRYGYRRVTWALENRNTPINHKKVLKIMNLNGLIVKKKKFKVCTTNSNHNFKVYPNRIKSLKVTSPNQVWVTDITYIRFGNNETAYLSAILDRCSRKCVGWQLSRNIDTQLCLDSLNMAFKNREGMSLHGLIHHSDRGSQYASNEYVTELEKHEIQISMSAKGNPYDNAYAESFNKTVKYEEVYMDDYKTFQDAYDNIKHFIEEVYNKKRLHSGIGYLPPTEFEQRCIVKEVLA